MLFCLSANHRNTGFDVLDRLSRVIDDAAAQRLVEHDLVRGAVVLATCNRFEAYLDVEDTPDPVRTAQEAMIGAVPELAADDWGSLRSTAHTLVGHDVVHHLFAVSSGLHSMVLGEEEITGQVQRALARARERGTTSPPLEQVFQRAAYTTREVRARGDLSAAGRTVARTALEMAGSRLTDWSSTRVLVVGTGQYAATTVNALRARGADDITVYSATGRAEHFAARLGLRAAADDVKAAIAEADVVITCTSHGMLRVEHMPDHQPRLLIDLGLPRNVDPAVAGVPGVELIDLELIGRHASLPELSGDDAHQLVGSHAMTFTAERSAAPAIVAVRSHIQAALDAELARIRPDAPGADETAAALRHLASVLSHTPSVRARELAADDRLEEFEAALETVFGVTVASPDTAEAADGERAAG